MTKRIESSSSINAFLQCNRKYYFQYIEKLPTFSSIHMVRGNIAHSTLEEFYNLDVSEFGEEYKKLFLVAIQKIFFEQWGKYKEELKELGLSNKELEFYFEDTLLMVMNWCSYFLIEFNSKFKGDILDTFNLLKPKTEVEYVSESYSVRGFIDAIREIDGKVQIIDYKTNNVPEIKDSIKLQLGVYSLLYREKHGKLPDMLGVFFLKDKMHRLDVDESLIKNAINAINMVHSVTSVSEKKEDYPRKTSGLCKWSSGQCDFYHVCRPFD